MVNSLFTVKDLLDYSAEKFAEKDFCRFFRNDSICTKSFIEFRRDSLAVSKYIKSIEDKKIHIAFIGKTNYEYIACLTGMICSGNTVVPFSPDISVDEACRLFEDADIEMLFCEEDFMDTAAEINESYKKIKQIVSLGDWQWFDNIFTSFSDEAFSVPLNPDDRALIIYTSGTTGIRKGVMLSHLNLAANSTYDTYTGEEGEVNLSVLPMHHVFCYACDVLKNLYDGGTICLNGSLTDLYKNLLAFQPHNARIVPLLCKAILTKIRISHRRNPQLSAREAAETVTGKNLKKFIVGSAFLSPAIIDEFEKYGITARQGYGMTECSPRITTADFSQEHKYSNGILTGVDEVRVQDGEIQVKGPSVMSGYYKKAAITADSFTEDGFLHTGDLGYIEDSHVYLTGRKKNLIILSNGENISPEEIENHFADDEFIKEIVVYSKDDRIVAEIYPEEAYALNLSDDEIVKAAEKSVDAVNAILHSDRQIANIFIRKKPFARTSTGKIIRPELKFKECEK